MSTSVYTGLNPFNFIRKHFLQTCLCLSAQRLSEHAVYETPEKIFFFLVSRLFTVHIKMSAVQDSKVVLIFGTPPPKSL